VSPFSPGGVSSTSNTTEGSKLTLIGLQLYSCKVTLSQSIKNNSAQPKDSFDNSTCSKVN